MAIDKKKPIIKKKKRALTKRDIANKRVAYIKKVLEKKKKEKILKKKKIVSYKKRINKQAEDENIELTEPKIHTQNATEDQFNILSILGLGPESMNKCINWQNELQKKLKQVNEKSIDNPQVRRVYGQIGRIFSTYRSGKIPKAFKIIPNLQKWNEVLLITRPDNWTPQAMYQAVNIFASNFDPVRAQDFYKNYLVPAIKADLKKSKKLNYHYFQSLKKALYKTNSWFKGLLFQFCDEHTLLKQIKVMESLLTKMSIPVISASVGMIKMMQMTPCSATIHYLSALMSKNYGFPVKVITTLTSYILGFDKVEEDLPVIWYQLVLILAKQYGNCVDEMSKAAIINLVKKKNHKLISPQIIKHLS